MNFSDTNFIFIFLPISLIIYYLARHFKCTNRSILVIIIFISTAFYIVNPMLYILLFLSSIFLNYYFAKLLIISNGKYNNKIRLSILITIILLNLSSLIYFKFLLLDVNPLTISRNLNNAGSIILPLGISFYTFQQIALQVDCYWNKLKEINFLEYSAFISFFPQLIAGPIVYHKEMMSQFKNLKNLIIDKKILVSGILIFSIGLFKKTMFADNLANGVDKVYIKLFENDVIPILDAWLAVISFPLQVYFDFSGYTDMACGLALMFGLKLSQNFNSPFKADNIIDFWNRWHISLMRFFRDYIFNPISFSSTKYALKNNFNNLNTFIFALFIPVMIVFLITGIWHGSSINFVLYGVFHGLAVTTNHFWKTFKLPKLPKFLSWILTFTFVSFAFILMRSDNFDQFLQVINSLFFGHFNFKSHFIEYFGKGIFMPLFVLFLLIIVKKAPNSNQIVIDSTITGNQILHREMNYISNKLEIKVFLAGCLLGLSFIALTLNSNNFIYFQF